MAQQNSKEYQHAYYLKNRERIIARTSAYGKAHPEMKREDSRKQYRKNRKKRIADVRKWEKENPERTKEMQRESRKRCRDRVRASNRASYRRHKEARTEYSRKMYNTNPDVKKSKKDGDRKWRLKTKYGLTVEQFDEMLLSQKGHCALCAKPMSKPIIEHCHKTGIIRGLVHQQCNAMIGMAQDDPEVLRSAIVYLNRFRSDSEIEDIVEGTPH